MPDQSVNVSEHLLVAGQPDAVAVQDRTGTYTYADLRVASAAVAQRLLSWNLSPGARVGLLSGNSFFWVAAYLGIIRSGLVAVPFATVLTPQDVAAKAAFVGCEAFLLESHLDQRFGSAVTAVRRVDDERAMTGNGAAAAVRVSPDSDAVLVFTSGTTASPRAVRVTHRNIWANTDSIVDYLQLARDDRILVVLPFSYCYGASLLHTHLRVGASLSILETFAFPETVIEAIGREGCTGFAGVPSTYQLLLRASSFESTRLPTLRTMQQAGGRLSPPQLDRVAAAQPGARLFVMYGATEATARLSYLPPDVRESRPGSIGKGIRGVSLRVVDEDGRDVPVGTVGEIFAQGESITAGYWNDPEGSATKYVRGGLLTGDLARVDDDGFIYVVDRRSDFIKSWGFRVSTHEIEDVLLAMPGVSAAAVVGRPDEDAGEAIVAFCTVDPAQVVSAEDIRAHCRRTLARPLVPQEIRLVPELPLNQNGKIVKAVLRDWAQYGDTRQGEGA